MLRAGGRTQTCQPERVRVSVMRMLTPRSYQHVSAFSTGRHYRASPDAARIFPVHREARALQPLLHLLNVGSQLAGGERRAAIAALLASATALVCIGLHERCLPYASVPDILTALKFATLQPLGSNRAWSSPHLRFFISPARVVLGPHSTPLFLQALEPLVGEPSCQAQLADACIRCALELGSGAVCRNTLACLTAMPPCRRAATQTHLAFGPAGVPQRLPLPHARSIKSWAHVPALLCSASGQLDLLGLLRPLLAAATAPELSLSAYAASPLAGPWADALSGGQTVAAGWHAAAVAAALCSGGGSQMQALQDALVSRGLLPLLARFAVADVPLQPTGAAAVAAGLVAQLGGRRVDELLMAIK